MTLQPRFTPSSFGHRIDFGPLVLQSVHCVATSLVERGQDTLYILRQKNPIRTTPRWHLATSSYETIAFSLCSGYIEIESIARLLLYCHMPFHTVLEIENWTPAQDTTAGRITRPRPHCPSHYEPSEQDYACYKAQRMLLVSERGRAFRLHGGIAARLALDAGVNDDVVLGGPAYANAEIGYLGNVSFVDDKLDKFDVDFMCGRHRTQTLRASNRKDLFWWPGRQCYLGESWNERLESWFIGRKGELEKGYMSDEFVLRTGREWAEVTESGGLRSNRMDMTWLRMRAAPPDISED